jgi:hypothetical protein
MSVVATWLLYRKLRDRPPVDVAAPAPQAADYQLREVDRSCEGEPLPPLPEGLHGEGHSHRHGPSAVSIGSGLLRCPCGDVGTYRLGQWRPARFGQLWRAARQAR